MIDKNIDISKIRVGKIQGVYLITNLINNKKYVGISNDIKQRWHAHVCAAKNENYNEYHTPLHRAIRKYGIENFSLQVLEEIEDYCQIDEYEKKWIQYYNSYNEGYNQTPGGKTVFGEDHHHAALTNEEVANIRRRWAACEETVKEIHEDFKDKISYKSMFHITSWERYPSILPELNTEERREWHKQKGKEQCAQARSKLSDEDVINIRIRHHLGEGPTSIHNDYNYVTLNVIHKVCYYSTRKYITKEQIKKLAEERKLSNE